MILKKITLLILTLGLNNGYSKVLDIPVPTGHLKGFKSFVDSPKAIKAAKKDLLKNKKKRGIANSDIDGEALLKGKKKYLEMREKYLNAKDDKAFRELVHSAHAWVEKCQGSKDGSEAPTDKECTELSSEAKFLYVQMSLLYSYEGILYRMRPYVEQHPTPHSFMVTTLRRMGSNINVLDRSDQTKLAFDYMSKPSLAVKDRLIKNDTQFQAFIANEQTKVLYTAFRALSHIDFSKGVINDKKIVFGTDSFDDSVQRYVIADEGDQNLMLSRLARNYARWAMFLAYDFSGMLELVKGYGKLNGVDGFKTEAANFLGFGGSYVIGATAKDRKGVIDNILKNKKYSNFMKKQAKGDDWMKTAYQALVVSVQKGDLAWQVIKDRPNGSRSLFPAFTATFYEDLVGHNIEALNNVITSKSAIAFKSTITGRTASFNVYEYFHNPPENLVAFLPTGFKDKDQRELKHEATGKTYRNYLYESASAWNTSAYSQYFPGISDVPETMKTLRTSHGSSFFRGLRLPLML